MGWWRQTEELFDRCFCHHQSHTSDLGAILNALDEIRREQEEAERRDERILGFVDQLLKQRSHKTGTISVGPGIP